MKIKIGTALLMLFWVNTSILFAQTITNEAVENNSGYAQGFNISNNPCITPKEYKVLEMESQENIKRLGLSKDLSKGTNTTMLNWPIQAATGFTDCDYYFIGAYVDHNIAAGSFQDFDCGLNTYDGHHGTDIAAWPYGFYKMDNNQVEVVAAAPGIIIQKADGNFDRNCSTNNLTANSIIIQHADGSEALYWHMKKNSVTTKTVGQSVVSGEYLGVAGSSGSASGPHLHFEVWTGNTNSTYIDPFFGTCNTINASSWWSVQRPHTNPAVIKVSVNTTDIVMPGCPTTETPNESNSFAIPFQGAGLGPGYAKFYIFIRDDVSGMTADCKILNPNGTIFNNWTYTSTANNKAYIKGYSKLLPTQSGSYIFEATYNGITCSTNFNISQVSGVSTLSGIRQFQILNDAEGKIFTINGEGIDNGNCNFALVDITGRILKEENEKIINNSIHKNISISEIPNGIYFLTIGSEKTTVSRKLILQY